MEPDLEKKQGPSPPSSEPLNTDYGQIVTNDQPLFSRFLHSFRENPNARVSEVLLDDNGKPLPYQPPAQPALAHKLKERHLQMIAIGGSIGTSPYNPRALSSAHSLPVGCNVEIG